MAEYDYELRAISGKGYPVLLGNSKVRKIGTYDTLATVAARVQRGHLGYFEVLEIRRVPRKKGV